MSHSVAGRFSISIFFTIDFSDRRSPNIIAIIEGKKTVRGGCENDNFNPKNNFG
ncbi:MAG: hypothetical protein KME17_10040 [Cyanosarcina radialis HA8281-LM2]|nr:hypothetical protein [Cyanosarcina radialis HA8281-LM2]